MHRARIPFFITLAVALLTTASTTAYQHSRTTDLALSESLTRPLSPGEPHTYCVTLDAGEYASIVLTEQGIVVATQTRMPDGSAIAEFHGDVGGKGTAQLDLVAESAGTYTIAIRPETGEIRSASYSVRLASRRPAT